ncbi:MAG: phage protease, partial [Magnetococcales bacterium]|nr:phage protease [Magnetococcales bacterium]
GLAVCVFEIASAAGEIQLFPAGEFRAGDGRPYGLKAWRLDADIAKVVIANVAARANDLVIDYEHQTINAEWNGQPAPAAGWFKSLEWRDDGLWAVNVQFTETAVNYIEKGEYRYISPVFTYDQNTGIVIDILHAALVNFPAIDGMADLHSRAAARFQNQAKQEIPQVEPKQLRGALGLAVTATDDEVTAKIAALKQTAKQSEEAVATAKAEPPDPAHFVPVTMVEELKTEIAALKSGQEESQKAALIADGVAAGKLLPAQLGWAKTLQVASLKSYLETTPAIAALKGTQTQDKDPADGGAGEGSWTDDEMAVCKQAGISKEEFLAAKKEGE